MVENSRLPVDDPRTHLELTMVHEVMVLDHSGFDLALIQLANALKFGLYGTLMANLIIPPDWSLAPAILAYFGIQIGFAVLVGLLESFRARNKMGSNPQYLLTQIGIAFMLFFAVMIIKNNI
jgi:formate hydrogenlyase subunit 4